MPLGVAYQNTLLLVCNQKMMMMIMMMGFAVVVYYIRCIKVESRWSNTNRLTHSSLFQFLIHTQTNK